MFLVSKWGKLQQTLRSLWAFENVYFMLLICIE
jgi:hypothetical protein